MAKRAIIRPPGLNYCNCISSHPRKHDLDLKKAKLQHKVYGQTLSDLGLDIIELPPDNANPDSCFVEDTVVIKDEKAFITRPKPQSRQKETESIESILKAYLTVTKASPPATIEGGDVIHMSDHLISGITQRTNTEGVQQMSRLLGINVLTITDSSIIHLKSHVTNLDRNTMLSVSRFADHPIIRDYDVLLVPDDEGYAANTLTVGETVLIPKGYPITEGIVKIAGFDVITLDMSEFAKCEGAMTCLSILF
ncbi:MAG: dimethylarginine dimethylaminohydrolase family protein [Candidatus Thorarchaeota archaeon]